MNALVEAMDSDQDQDILLLKQHGHVPLPQFFGLIHPLIGSDILCSPRSFGPAWILKTCIDFSSDIFDPEKGVHNLLKQIPELEGYTRFILSLYKKKFANKNKLYVHNSVVSIKLLSEFLFTILSALSSISTETIGHAAGPY